ERQVAIHVHVLVGDENRAVKVEKQETSEQPDVGQLLENAGQNRDPERAGPERDRDPFFAENVRAPDVAAGHPLPLVAHAYAVCSAGASGSSPAALVTSVGRMPCEIVSFVITHFVTSRRDGSSNITSRSAPSMIDRRPRAPVSRARAWSAISHIASSVKTSSM